MAATRSPSSTLPPAFCCTFTGRLMSEPGIALCGHLFDRNQLPVQCPRDGNFVNDDQWVRLPALSERINQWKQDSNLPVAPTGPSGPPPVVTTTVAREMSTKSRAPAGRERRRSASPPSTRVRARSASPDYRTAARPIPAGIERNRRCLFRVLDAHRDDIHVITRLASENFATGSKDGSLKVWNTQGKSVYTKGRAERGYEYWVTAMTSYQDGYFVCGTRDGLIARFRDDGTEIDSFQYQPRGNYKCKMRNNPRINCLTPIQPENVDRGCYFGTPCYFHVLKNQGPESFTQTSPNDWVYCVEPLDSATMLVVTGDYLEIYHSPGRARRPWHRGVRLVDPQGEKKGNKRPHISALTIIDRQSSICATVDFFGRLRRIDAFSERILSTYTAHRGRAWSVRSLGGDIVATCGDDQCLSLWDFREQSCRPTLVLNDHPGRVSVLLPINEWTIVSGSCPDDLKRLRPGQPRGILTFWDIRRT